MKERFTADPAVSENTYQKTWSRYPSFRIGIGGIVVCTGGMLYDLYNLYLWVAYGCGIINILIHVLILAGIGFLFYLSAVYMRSGGKGYLIDRGSMLLDVCDDHLSIRYSLTKREKKKYRAVRMNMYYCDIEGMAYNEKLDRVEISGDYAVERVPADGKSFDDAEVEDVENNKLILYDRFEDFDAVISAIEEASFKKVSYEDNMRKRK